MKIKPLVLGSNVFGWTATAEESFAVLDQFVNSGGDKIDTADVYSSWHTGNSGGESETIIGEWLASRNFKNLKIATKVSEHPEFQGLTPLNVKRAAEASLKRLGVSQIDLYYAHFDDAETPIVETAAAFSALKDEGKIKAIGLSNYSAERVREWITVAKQEKLHLPVALQPHYNLMERDYESNGLRKLALAEGLEVYSYYSLARGFLTGKYRTANDANAQGASPRAESAIRYLNTKGYKVLEALDDISKEIAASPGAISLAWVRQQPGITAPIVSAKNSGQMSPIAEAMKLTLSDEHIDQLNKASAETEE